MLVNLDTIPVWAVVLGEAAALGLWGVTFLRIVKPQLRRRIPVALAVVATLSVVQAEIQQRGWREAVWIPLTVGIAFALSAIGKRGGFFARYYQIEEEYGKTSKQMNLLAMKYSALITMIIIVLLVPSAVFIKGAFSQGA